MRFFEEFWQYSRAERNGIVVMLLILAIMLGLKLWLYLQPPPEMPLGDYKQFEQEILTFAADTLVHLNTAQDWELENLPGIGRSYAERILAYRDSIGRFDSIQQLMDVHGIGPAKFEKIAPYITVE